MLLVDSKTNQSPEFLLESKIVSLKGDVNLNFEEFPSAWGLVALLKNSLEFHRMSGNLKGMAGFCRIEMCIDGKSSDPTELLRHKVKMDVSLGDGITSIQSSRTLIDVGDGAFLDEPKNMFRRIVEYTVDSKGRITIPKRFSRRHGNENIRVVMTSGPEDSLLVVEESFWNQWHDQRSNDNNFMRDYYIMHQEAKRVHPINGRVLVTNSLRKHSRLIFREDVSLFEINGFPSLLLIVPSAEVKERVKNGCMSYIAQKLTFDLSF